MGKHRAALDALTSVIRTAVESIDFPDGFVGCPQVRRSTTAPVGAGDSGEIIIQRGSIDSVESEMGGMGTVVFEHTLTVPVEVFFGHPYDDVMLDVFELMTMAITAAIAADNSLGGVVDYAKVVRAQFDSQGDGATEVEEAALITITCGWSGETAFS